MWNDQLTEFIVMVLRPERFRRSRGLPGDFSFIEEPPRTAEVELLRSEFDYWRTPYLRQFAGARQGSLIAMGTEGLTVGLVYLGFENQIRLKGCGQVHYPVIREDFRGRGLYAPMLAELLRRAADARLAGVIVVTNREGHPELYERWGALRIGTLEPVRGSRRVLRRFVNPHRSLAHRAAVLLGQRTRLPKTEITSYPPLSHSVGLTDRPGGGSFQSHSDWNTPIDGSTRPRPNPCLALERARMSPIGSERGAIPSCCTLHAERALRPADPGIIPSWRSHQGIAAGGPSDSRGCIL